MHTYSRSGKYQRPHQLRSAKMFLQRSWVCSTSSALFTITITGERQSVASDAFKQALQIKNDSSASHDPNAISAFHFLVTSLSSEPASISILTFFTLLNLIPLQLILHLLNVLNLCILSLLLTRVAHVAGPELF